MSEILGIDIGIGSVKLVAINKEEKGLVLESIGEAKTPRVNWTKDDKSGKAMAEIAATIKMLLSDLKIK